MSKSFTFSYSCKNLKKNIGFDSSRMPWRQAVQKEWCGRTEAARGESEGQLFY